jgi:hypothetical protein
VGEEWDGGAGNLSITSNFDILRRRWLEAIRRNRKVLTRCFDI